MNKLKNAKPILVLSIGLFISLTFVSFNWLVSADEKDEKAVMEVLMLEAKSIETNDMETLNKIWSNDESVLIFESGGMDKGWKEYRDHHLAPELKAFKNTKFTVSDAKVKVDGKTGWATYQYALSADYKDKKIESNGLGTMVFEKQEDGKWLIVHSHTSARPKKSS
jgi:ketosteroid isomerase-like protein